MPDAPAADTRMPLISDWSPSCCAEAPMKSAVRWVIPVGAELDTVESYEGSRQRAEGSALKAPAYHSPHASTCTRPGTSSRAD